MASLQDIVALSNQITEVITGAIVVPLLIFFGAVILGKIVRVITFSFLKSIEFDKHAFKLFTYRADYAELVAGSLAAIIYTVGTVWALTAAGVIILALQAVGIFLGALAGVALIVWLVDLLPNIFSYRKVKKAWNKGDALAVAGVTGTITSIGILSVSMQTSDQLTIAVPLNTVKKQAKKA